LILWCAGLLVTSIGCEPAVQTAQKDLQPAKGVAAMPLLIRNLDQPGAFEIENTGERIELAWDVRVQQKKGDAWEDRVVEDLRLVEDCQTPPAAPCRTLEKGTRVRPVPWTGFSHTAQCQKAARANVYLGPGTFRFVVSSCDGARKYYGDPFQLPERPPKPA
jgi:hypothetical protein